MTDLDLAAIGAGLAGLTCAQLVRQAGYRTAVFDKARGAGGRATTRRWEATCVDRGLPFWPVQGERSEQLAADLLAAQVLQPWPARALQATAAGWAELPQPPSYAAPAGASAIAQYLARDLERHHGYRLQALRCQGDRWQLCPESPDQPRLTARAVVLAMPAPQARALLAPLDPAAFPPLARALGSLAAVRFAPCLAVAAGYPAGALDGLPGQWLTFPGDRHLARLSWESSKRPANTAILVAYSTPEFAQTYLNTSDLQPAAAQLLQVAAARLALSAAPLWMLPHRWRYALVQRPAHQPYVTVSAQPPLLCCGDWCLGDRAEDALQSGAAAATAVLAGLAVGSG